MNRIACVGCCLLLSPLDLPAQDAAPLVSIHVQIVDEAGSPLAGVAVRAAFPGRVGGDGRWANGETDGDGKVSLTGRSFLPVSVIATRDGYYPSEADVQTAEWTDAGERVTYADQTIRMEMRRVLAPAPMYACAEVLLNVPALGVPLGFDLMKADWVSPHGEGETADLLFTISGDWNGVRDHDSALALRFSKDGDGILPFAAHPYSHFQSPRHAPTDGYAAARVWRKSRRPVPDRRLEWTIVDDTAQDANYVFRVRTVLRDDGTPENALYGKIHGAIAFGGATLDAPHNFIRFSYYLNPVANDRNLEFDPARNLIPGLQPPHRVRQP
jgi:hypothetical protein